MRTVSSSRDMRTVCSDSFWGGTTGAGAVSRDAFWDKTTRTRTVGMRTISRDTF